VPAGPSTAQDTFSFPATKRPDSSAHQSNLIARRGQLRWRLD
jgi:hypothetical protein